jgi:N-acetylmuramoyl-L-alanine amidase
MARIFLSPSTQEHNAYSGGSNEEVEMNDLVYLVHTILTQAGHIVGVGGKVSASDNANKGNIFKADYYISHHSNAGGGVGTEIWYYTNSKVGYGLARAIYDRLAPVTVSPDRGVKASTKYIELSKPRMPSIIIETSFHDKAIDAEEIRTHHSEYAQAIAQGILDYTGTSLPVAPPAVKPAVVVRPPKKLPVTPVLRKGASGNSVLILQYALNRHGYKLVPDGSFGKKTRSAVLRFQFTHLLVPDGVVGPKTWAKLGYK